MSQKQHVWMFKLILKPHFTTRILTNPSTVAFSLNIPLQMFQNHTDFCVTAAFLHPTIRQPIEEKLKSSRCKNKKDTWRFHYKPNPAFKLL